MKRSLLIIGLLTLAFLLFNFASSNPTYAQPYYKGKTMTIMVPHGVGGGTDVFARLVARYLPKYIPGNPTVIVRNMLGGMALVAPNYVYKVAKRDGLTILAGSGVTAIHNILRTKGIKFTYDDMLFVLVSPSGDTFYTYPKLCPSLKDLPRVGKNLVFGAPPMPWPIGISYMLTRELVGFENKKDVLAFDSSADTRRAFLARELDITGESTIGYTGGISHLVKKGDVLALWQTGVYDAEGNLVRQGGAAADIPTVAEFYKMIHGKEPSGPEWDALSAYIIGNRTINKSLLFPPGCEKYLAILRVAATKMANDPKFLKEGDKILLGAPVYTGDDARRIVDKAASLIQASRPWLQDWLHRGWGVEFEK